MSPTPPVTTAAQALQSTTPLVTPTVQAPATLQTTVIPQGQVINPDQPATQAAPAAQEQVINAMERRQSTEAWLANPARMSSLAGALSQVKAPLQTGASGLQVSKLTRPVMQTEPVGRAEMVESVERRMMTESWLSNTGKGLPVAGAALKMTQPALPALNMLDSAAMAPLSLPESSGALGSSPSQPMTLNPVALPAQAAANVNRAPDRWMHVDDLGKQFGSVIQSSLLNRSVAGQTSLRIILSPENMGSIEAEIIDNNHTVTVNLLAQSDEVVRMLRDNSQALRDALGQSGTFELNIQKDRSGPDAQQSRDSSSSNGNRNNSQTTGLGLESTETAKNAKSASDTGALDTYV
jgi:flagellar hook-length control protein FliK